MELWRAGPTSGQGNKGKGYQRSSEGQRVVSHDSQTCKWEATEQQDVKCEMGGFVSVRIRTPFIWNKWAGPNMLIGLILSYAYE